jgi:hypothetical protein
VRISAVTDHAVRRATGSGLGAAALAAVLAVTGCGAGSHGGKASHPPSPAAAGAAGGAGAGAGSGAPATPAGSGDSADSDDSGDAGRAADACKPDAVSPAATNEDGEGRDPRHLLLTLTNAGDKPCTLYRYPYARLGTYSRSPVPAIEDSAPRGTVTLAPGAQAYAALLVGGGRTDAYETKAIALLLQDRDPGSTTGDPVPFELPAVASFDEGARVTYWTTAQGDALDFVMSR